jgi:cell division protein FtsI (penicillin-binding protein 3)
MGNFNLSRSRINILVIGIFVLFSLLALQLFRVQVVQASSYQRKAANEMQSTRVIPAPRGEITDVNGIAFALSVSAITIVVDQTQITDPARVANFVAPILGLSVADVQNSITGTRKYSIVLKNGRPALWDKLTQDIYDYNKALDNQHFDQRIIGFFPERSYIREYPSGSLISSLVGFVRTDGIGATGLESSLNSTITGTEGK